MRSYIYINMKPFIGDFEKCAICQIFVSELLKKKIERC